MKVTNIVTSTVLLISLSSQLFATEKQASAEENNATINGEISMIYDKDNKNQWGDAEFEATYAFNPQLDAFVLLKRQGGDEKPNKVIIDEAFVNYHFNENTNLSLGKVAILFGAFDTNMITDPLTKGVTDADKGSDHLLMLSHNFGVLEASAYTYKAEDEDKDAGLSVRYSDAGFSAGYGYFKDGTSGRGHSQALQLGFEADNGISGFYEKVNTNQVGKNTAAEHLELNYAHVVSDLEANLSLAHSAENAAQGNTKQLGVTYGVDVYEGLNIAIEHNKVKNTKALQSLKVTYTF